MLTFQAMGDGNCLYNSEAILLVQAFKEKELDRLFKNKQHLSSFHQLLKIYQGNGLIQVTDNPTQKAVKDGFTQLIAKYTVNGVINWEDLQENMATGLREFVQNAIMTDEATRGLVKTELVQALNFSIDMAYQDGVLPAQVEQNGIDGSYFQEMTVIKEKIIEILNDADLNTAELKKAALQSWFFDGVAVGFSDYLQGETGIGNPNIHAADIEIKVLSHKLGMVHRTYMRGQVGNEQPATYYNGFLSNDKSRQFPKNSVLFSLEKSPNHWNALFIDTPANKAFIDAKQEQQKDAELQAFLTQFGSYEAHRQSMDIAEEDYCQLYGLTKAQFNAANNAKVDADKPKPADEAAPKVSDSKPAKTPKVSATAKEPSVVKPKANVDAATVPNTLNRRHFALNFLAAAAVFATLSHCFLVPFLKVAVFGAALPHLALLSLAFTVLVSVAGGLLVANKLTANAVQEATKNAVTEPKTTSPSNNDENKPEAEHIPDAPKAFVVHYNTRAQQAKREKMEVMEGRPANVSRHKLH